MLQASVPFFLFVISLALMVIFSAFGNWIIGLALAPIALVLGIVSGNAVLESLARPARDVAHATYERLWGSARVARVSVASWSHAGRVGLSVRAKQRQLHHRRERLLRLLGEAVYSGDDARAEILKLQALANDDQIKRCEETLRTLRTRANEQVETERSATAPTQILSGENAVSEPRN